MSQSVFRTRLLLAFALPVALAAAWPTTAAGQTVTGQARAVQVSTPFGTSALADTGTLGGPSDARDASMVVGRSGSVVSAEVLHATTLGLGDRVSSQVSLANVGVRVGLTSVTADMVMGSVASALGAPATASALVGNLAVNGIPVDVTGSPNQLIAIPGGQIVINEQVTSATGASVNALRVSVAGEADVILGAAAAGIR
jgi:hypothetical protein